MGVQGVPPAFLAAALLLCADPVTSSQGSGLESMLQSSLEDAQLEVVAASPVPAGHGVGSHYGWRTSTRTGTRTFHAGTDFLVERGTPVFAASAGVVELVTDEADRGRRWAGYGNAIVIRHGRQDRWSFYAHLDSVSVQPGQRVAAGQRLGTVGNTTNGRFPQMVPHLHLEVRRAQADGSSPFPGRYGRHNLDPEEWLAELGVHLEADAAEAEACVHTDGHEQHEAPMLVVRERTSPATLASSASGTGRF